MKRRIRYVESNASGLVGPARVRFSNTGKTVSCRDESLQNP